MTALALRRALAAVLVAAAAAGLSSCTGTAAAPELASPETAEVVAVVDGDTIDVQTAEGEARVRLIGLDAPEIDRDGGEDDCYAQEARTALDELIYGQEVELRADPSQDDTDRYGRLLRHVYIDGRSAALTLIEAGDAHEYTYEVPYVGQAEHRAAEADAQEAARGLWGSCAE